jgi:hypothetical protein
MLYTVLLLLWLVVVVVVVVCVCVCVCSLFSFFFFFKLPCRLLTPLKFSWLMQETRAATSLSPHQKKRKKKRKKNLHRPIRITWSCDLHEDADFLNFFYADAKVM